jgi:ribosomal protein S9
MLVSVLVLALAIGAATASARVYSGAMTNGAGAVRSGEQGAIWQSRFVEHKRGRVDYSVCVIFRDARRVVQCKPGRTTARGVDRATFSEFVNLHPGLWVVRFFHLGRTLASWRFTVRPEGA